MRINGTGQCQQWYGEHDVAAALRARVRFKSARVRPFDGKPFTVPCTFTAPHNTRIHSGDTNCVM